MRKQARKLWLGDWQRYDAADETDTVLIVPDGEVDDTQSGPGRGVAIAIAVALLFLLGFALSSSGDDKWLASVPSQVQQAQVVPQPRPLLPQPGQTPQGPPPQGFGGGGDLTGSDAVKAAQAAVRQFPGDVERVTPGPRGSDYVVHVIQGDGNEVHVLVSPKFKVQGSDANQGPRNFGSGTPQ